MLVARLTPKRGAFFPWLVLETTHFNILVLPAPGDSMTLLKQQIDKALLLPNAEKYNM